jgi:hypothetical protein
MYTQNLYAPSYITILAFDGVVTEPTSHFDLLLFQLQFQSTATCCYLYFKSIFSDAIVHLLRSLFSTSKAMIKLHCLNDMQFNFTY